MKTYLEIEDENANLEYLEAKRLLKIMNSKSALLCCEELAKLLPSINDTPPVKRLCINNYSQFYRFGVTFAINKIIKKP